MIDDLLASPYVKGARGENGQHDCFSLFRELCKRRGIDVPNHPQPETPEYIGVAIADGIVTDGWVELDAPEAGCAVAIRIGRYVSHLGMVLDDVERFIHTNEKTGVTIARLDDPRWIKRIAGFYRHA